MLWCLLLLGVILAQDKPFSLQKSQIYYTDTKYPRFGFNFTLGVLAGVTIGKEMANSEGIMDMLGTVCTAVQYNQGMGDVKLSGILNVQAINTESENTKIYYEAMQLLQTNLASPNATLQAQIQTPFAATMGALVGSSDFQSFLAISNYFTGFKIPLVSYSMLAQNENMGTSESINIRSLFIPFYSINPSSSPQLMSAINQFLLQMNWTFVGVLFEQSLFGGLGVTFVEESRTKNITYACKSEINYKEGDSTLVPKGIIEDFAQCLERLNTVNVVLLWMSFTNCVLAQEIFAKLGYTGYTFICAYKQPTTVTLEEPAQSLLAYSYYFSTEIELPTEQELEKCLEYVYEGRPGALVTGLKEILTDYFRIHEKCEIYAKDLEKCTAESKERGDGCACDVYDYFESANYTYKYSYAADAVSTVANAIYLLENNCTELNEDYKLANSFLGLDFCTPDFTQEKLSYAMNRVKFMGRTGPVSFFLASLLRRTAVFNVWQYNAAGTPIKVGTTATMNNSLELDFSAMTFADGKVPTSEIVTQVPNLSDAVVAVFFSLFIAQICLSVGLFVWVLWRRNHVILRRKSPLFLTLIILGAVLVLTGGILLSIGLSDSAMCILHAFCIVLGMTIILSSLMAKNWRIYRIFSNPSASAVFISDSSIVLFPAVLTLVSLALLFTYSFAGGTLYLKILQADENPYYVFELCCSPTEWFQTFMVILFYVYLFILLAITAGLAFVTRHAKHTFRESKSIAMIIYIYLCMGLIFIPLYYVQGSSTESQLTRYSIASICTSILMLATEAIIFIPEIIAVRRWNRINREAED